MREHSELLETANFPANCILARPERLHVQVHDGPVIAAGAGVGAAGGAGVGEGVTGLGVGGCKASLDGQFSLAVKFFFS